MENYIDRLNPNQRRAVMTTEGALLVLAGAGSGKTTMLASRVAYILENTDTRPWQILAITFTNKAADEMRDRIAKYADVDIQSMWAGTFHSICVRILRTCIDRIGYTPEFVIYDSDESKTLIKECILQLGLDDKEYPPKSLLSIISRAKNDSTSPEEFMSEYGSHPRMKRVGKVYGMYMDKLRANNALDFDDLILHTVKILKNEPDIREKYRDKFKYILVDEYQDTNNTQYELISLLVNDNSNICVVGDDDQSIYKFRGANIDNILNFQKDYSNALRITLDENYRSTSNILDAANAVISNNKKRMGKNLWTNKARGELITSYTGYTEREEASFIARKIRQERANYGRFSDCAVLYRTNAQSRAIEEALMYEAIPYKVLAGQRFYDRKEIKDIVAYLKVIYNPRDSLSIRRIINEPKRKIGNATIDKVLRHEAEDETTMFEVLRTANNYEDLKNVAVRLKDFADMIEEFRVKAYNEKMSVDKLVEYVLDKSGYIAMLKNEDTTESKTRIENIEEFVNVAYEFAHNKDTEGKLNEFLEKVMLVSDIDSYDSAEDCAVLMTVHSAKGLEFPVVFLAGMEEDLFPSQRSMMEDEDLEEERRLCYVAITRAKEKLYMTRAESRLKFGQRMPNSPSRFLNEIPREYIKDESTGGVRARNIIERAGVSIRPETEYIKARTRQDAPPAVNEFDFRPGDRVRHRKFGDGTVVSSQAFGKDAIVVIDFDGAGTKRLMAVFAKLERIMEGDSK